MEQKENEIIDNTVARTGIKKNMVLLFYSMANKDINKFKELISDYQRIEKDKRGL